jgi:hypothetical protein
MHFDRGGIAAIPAIVTISTWRSDRHEFMVMRGVPGS